jgi:hypothetical protein
MGYYRPGLVEVDSPLVNGATPHVLNATRVQALFDTLVHYKSRPDLRASIAREGRTRFRSRTCVHPVGVSG